MSFSQFLAILIARWKISAAVFFTIVLATLAYSLSLDKQYTATASIVIEAKPDPLLAAIYSGGVNSSLIATQIDVLTSNRVAVKVTRNLKLTENPDIRAQWLENTKGEGSIEQWLSLIFSKSLEVRPSRDSNVIYVSYRAADPKFAAGLANAFVQAYLETNLELRVDPAKQFATFFESRAKDSRDSLEAAQTRLSEFQRERGIVASDERLDIENSRLNELSSQLVGLQALASDSGSRQNASRGGQADRMQEVLSSGLISGLKADQARLNARLEEMGSKFGDSHPQVIEAKANLAELQKRIDAETGKVTGSLGISNSINMQRVSELRASLNAQRAKILEMKAVRDEGAVLVRDVENAQRTYDQTIQRLNQTTLESQATQSNISVLTQAQPPTVHTSPRVGLNTLISIFLGAIVCIGVALAVEMYDRRIRSSEDVVAALALPVIGVMLPPTAKRLFGRSAKANLKQLRLLGLGTDTGKSA
jgi:succinoglycan biosynthesis transport protein ExoP